MEIVTAAHDLGEPAIAASRKRAIADLRKHGDTRPPEAGQAFAKH